MEPSSKLKIFTTSIVLTLMAQAVENLPAMQETWVQSLGWEDPQIGRASCRERV